MCTEATSSYFVCPQRSVTFLSLSHSLHLSNRIHRSHLQIPPPRLLSQPSRLILTPYTILPSLFTPSLRVQPTRSLSAPPYNTAVTTFMYASTPSRPSLRSHTPSIADIRPHFPLPPSPSPFPLLRTLPRLSLLANLRPASLLQCLLLPLFNHCLQIYVQSPSSIASFFPLLLNHPSSRPQPSSAHLRTALPFHIFLLFLLFSPLLVFSSPIFRLQPSPADIHTDSTSTTSSFLSPT